MSAHAQHARERARCSSRGCTSSCRIPRVLRPGRSRVFERAPCARCVEGFGSAPSSERRTDVLRRQRDAASVCAAVTRSRAAIGMGPHCVSRSRNPVMPRASCQSNKGVVGFTSRRRRLFDPRCSCVASRRRIAVLVPSGRPSQIFEDETCEARRKLPRGL